MATSPTLAGLLIAAPPTLLRHGLLQTLRETWPERPVRLTTDAAQLPALLRRQPCLLLIIDGTALPAALLPGVLQQVRALCPQLPLLVLTGRRHATLAAVAGAMLRLLPASTPPAKVAHTVAELLHLASTLPPPAASRRLAPLPTDFSRRELEVLTLVMADLCNEQIATQLCLSVRTVESHRRALLQKAGVRTPVGLVMRAVREGWVIA